MLFMIIYDSCRLYMNHFHTFVIIKVNDEIQMRVYQGLLFNYSGIWWNNTAGFAQTNITGILYNSNRCLCKHYAKSLYIVYTKILEVKKKVRKIPKTESLGVTRRLSFCYKNSCIRCQIAVNLFSSKSIRF